MDHLKRISIEGYKSIRHATDVELTPLTVLIGANGAGKSNLISFFRLLNFTMTNPLSAYVASAGYAVSLLHRGPKVTQEITATLDFSVQSDPTTGYRLTMAHANGGLFFRRESLRVGSGNAGVWLDLGVGMDRSLLGGHGGRIHDLLADTRTYQFHDTSATSPMRGKVLIDDNRYLFEHAGNLAAMLYRLKLRQAAAYDVIVETVRLVAPFFEDFALEPDRLNPSVIDLRWRESGSTYEMGPHQLSDGSLRFIALATLLCLPSDELPRIVILDEPELGLHPAAVAVLGGLIRAATASVQVIVSTQSATLVDQMEVEDVMVVEREEGQSVFRRLSEAELKPWLAEYSLGELWEKNVLGGRP
jgi:predicted ATPase